MLRWCRTDEASLTRCVSTAEILQTDSGLEWDPVTQTVVRVNGEPFDPSREYRVVINCGVLVGMDNHVDLMEYVDEKDMTVFETHPDFPAVILRTLTERLWSAVDKEQHSIDAPERLKADLQSATGIPIVNDRLIAMMWQYFPTLTPEQQRLTRSSKNGSISPHIISSLDASIQLDGSHSEL